MSSSPAVAPFVGRHQELTTLSRLAGITEGPRPGSILLSGDAGMGKSRLLGVLAQAAMEQGWRVAVGHCLDLGGSPLAYLPFAELAARLEEIRPERMAQLADRWPDLRRLLPSRSRATPTGESMDRGRFFSSLHSVLTELARETPLLVVIEDVHWADQSTCDLLSFLLARGFTEPVSVVVSYRSDDLHRRHPLRTIAAGWSRLPGVARLELDPLPDEQVRLLVGALHPQPLGEAAVQTIVERAEGNAFFAEELVAAAGSPALPRDLAGLLLLRLDQLEPDARIVVRAASAGGGVVRDAVLLAVTGLDAPRLESAVRTAVELNILVPADHGYRFRHSILAEAIYGDLLPGECNRLHAAFVSALQAATAPSTAADLARHAVAAEDHATAFQASVRAGDDAVAMGGRDEAARHYAVALDLLNSSSGGPWVDRASVGMVALTEKAASAAADAGLVQRAATIVSSQLRRLPDTAAAVDRARLLVALATTAALSDSGTDLVAVTAEALALVPPEPPTVLRGRAVAAYAMALNGARRDEEAGRWAEEGLAMPPEVRPGEVSAQLQTVLARISERSGDAKGSTQILQQLAQTARENDDPSEVRVLHQLGSIHFEQGELVDALAVYRRGARRSIELGRPYAPYGVDCRMLGGLAAYQLGQWDLAAEMVDMGSEEVPPLAAAGLLSVTLTVRAGRGELTGWPELLARTAPEWRTDGMVALHAAGAAIDLAGDAGDLDTALSMFDDALTCLVQNWGSTDFQARIRLTALLVGQLAGHLPDPGSASAAALVARAEELAEVADRAAGLGRRPERGVESRAWLHRLQAELLRLQDRAGRDVDAAQHATAWRTSAESFARYGHVYEQARSQARLAAALQASGHRDESWSTAREALEVARRLGAAPLVAELRPLLGSAPGGGPAVDVLTPREREVLLLVAVGRSNREIGEALFISTKTASVHVSNILGKLGARTRTEAATSAQRRGLLGS